MQTENIGHMRLKIMGKKCQASHHAKDPRTHTHTHTHEHCRGEGRRKEGNNFLPISAYPITNTQYSLQAIMLWPAGRRTQRLMTWSTAARRPPAATHCVTLSPSRSRPGAPHPGAPLAVTQSTVRSSCCLSAHRLRAPILVTQLTALSYRCPLSAPPAVGTQTRAPTLVTKLTGLSYRCRLGAPLAVRTQTASTYPCH